MRLNRAAFLYLALLCILHTIVFPASSLKTCPQYILTNPFAVLYLFLRNAFPMHHTSCVKAIPFSHPDVNYPLLTHIHVVSSICNVLLHDLILRSPQTRNHFLCRPDSCNSTLLKILNQLLAKFFSQKNTYKKHRPTITHCLKRTLSNAISIFLQLFTQYRTTMCDMSYKTISNFYNSEKIKKH